MSTEQDNKQVSNTYREVAREVTPRELDERILENAARDARSRYGFARAWVRPVAWAATIGLSLAFMLELTWFVDTSDEVPAPVPAVSEERARQDAGVMKAKQEDSLNQAGAQISTVPASHGAEPESPSAAASPVVEEAALLRRAEKQARSQADTAQTDAIVSYDASADADHACDNDARATAESWYQCIRDLRQQGLEEDAAAELEALLRTFPDFREPPPK